MGDDILKDIKGNFEPLNETSLVQETPMVMGNGGEVRNFGSLFVFQINTLYYTLWQKTSFYDSINFKCSEDVTRKANIMTKLSTIKHQFYRPVSLISNLAKVLEKVLRKRTQTF